MAEVLTAEQMDDAAELFKQEMDKLPQTISVPFARLWRKHFMRAGHKRLGRVMVALAKATDKMKDKDFTTPEDMEELNGTTAKFDVRTIAKPAGTEKPKVTKKPVAKKNKKNLKLLTAGK